MTWTPFGRVGVSLDQIPHAEIGQAPAGAVRPQAEVFARDLDRELGDAPAAESTASDAPGPIEAKAPQSGTQEGAAEDDVANESEVDLNSDAALANEELWLDDEPSAQAVVTREASPAKVEPRQSGSAAERAPLRTPRPAPDLLAQTQNGASLMRAAQHAQTNARNASDGMRVDASQAASNKRQSGTLQRRDKPAAPPPSARARHADVRSAEISQNQRDSIIRRVALALSTGGGEMRLQLQPQHLGHVAVRLQLEDRSLRLELRAERAEVSEALGRDLEALRHALQEQGLDVEHFDVRQDARAARDFERDSDEPFDSDDERASGTQSANEHDTSPSARVRAWRNGSGIDFVA